MKRITYRMLRDKVLPFLDVDYSYGNVGMGYTLTPDTLLVYHDDIPGKRLIHVVHKGKVILECEANYNKIFGNPYMLRWPLGRRREFSRLIWRELQRWGNT